MFVSSSFDGDTSVSIVTNKKPEIFRFNGDVILKARADLSGQFVQVTLSLDDLVEIYSFRVKNETFNSFLFYYKRCTR
jgi:hypothetical protein